MPTSCSATNTALDPRPVARAGIVARVRAAGVGLGKRLGAWLTDLEYRLRVSWPFTHGRGARRVFYPGCSLTAADPELVMRTYRWLRERDPEVELWSDCCGMPLEKFASPAAAEHGRALTRRKLRDAGTEEIITACGNCAVQFGALAVPGVRVTSLYGLLAEHDWGPRSLATPAVVHHPCSARIDKGQQQHFNALANRLELTVANADSSKHPLPCCLVRTPKAMAKRGALASTRLVTYCAHCTVAFQPDISTRHILQEVFGAPEDRWVRRGKFARFLQYRRFARLAVTGQLPPTTQPALPHTAGGTDPQLKS